MKPLLTRFDELRVKIVPQESLSWKFEGIGLEELSFQLVMQFTELIVPLIAVIQHKINACMLGKKHHTLAH